MAKKNIYNIVFCLVLAIFIGLYRFLIYPKLMFYSESLSAAFSILICAASCFVYGFRKFNNNRISKCSIKNVLFSIAIYFVFTYTIGLFIGFLNNSYSLELFSIVNNAIFPLIILLATEIFRYNFVKSNKDNKNILGVMTFLLFLFQLNFYVKMTTFSTIDSSFEFVTTILIPMAIENILFTYNCYHSDYKANIIYRLIMDLYVYIVPIQPDINPLITSITSTVLPFSILLSVTSGKDIFESRKAGRKSLIGAADIPFALAAVAIVCVIYGIGPYKMLGIETGSMMPNYNIGDAVVIDKNVNTDNLKVGDVIAYENVDNILIVHRIVKINSDKSFITKGDNNNVADSFYVQPDKVRGCVKVRIPFLAYPALLFK